MGAVTPMARPRKRPGTESAYERRIRRYLELHPGATRQEARGHKLAQGIRSEYAKRVQGTAPGSEERRRASGHRGYQDLKRALRSGDIVSIDPGSQRDARGRWTDVRITVLDADGKERVYRLGKVDEKKVRALVDRMEVVGARSSPRYPLEQLLQTEKGSEQLEVEAA